MDDLSKVVVLYGPNGSGKSTIAARLRDGKAECEPTATEVEVKVFDRHYKENFFAATTKPGVFLLGEDRPELLARREELIEKIQDDRKNIKSLRKQLGGEAPYNDGAREELSMAFADAGEQVWRLFRELPLIISDNCFKGLKNSKRKLLDAMLNLQPVDSLQDLTLESLVERATLLYQDSPAPSELLILPVLPDFESDEDWQLMQTPIVPRGKSELTQVFERLRNADWFTAGLEHAHLNDGKCPFCQQTLPDNFEAQVEAAFDESYEVQVGALGNLASRTHEKITSLNELIVALERNHRLGDRNFSSLAAEFRGLSQEIVTRIEAKLQAPAVVVQLPDLNVLLRKIIDVIQSVNSDIRSENAKIASLRIERQRLTDDARSYLAQVKSREVLESLKARVGPLQKKIDGVVLALAAKREQLEKQVSELREIEKSIGSDQGVVEYFNEVLESVGFHSFSIASERTGKGYVLVRDEGILNEDTLSEGEQAFVTFLYFYYEAQAIGSGLEKVLVVDDPISSLDSDALFSVSILTRKLIELINSPKAAASQVLVFTHNIYFHKELTYKLGSRGNKPSYFTLEKRFGAPNVLVRHENNPIKSSYAWLWLSFVNAREDTNPHNVLGVQNCMRRILESYFVLSGVGSLDQVLPNLTSPSERHAFKHLMSWANDGSHHVEDEFHFDPNSLPIEKYFEVFEKVFEVTGQIEHFRMMEEKSMSERKAPL